MSRVRDDSKAWPVIAALATALGASSLRADADGPLSDPTRPPVSAQIVAAEPDVPARGELSLRGIFHADDRRFAVIDGRRVEVGDRIAGAELIAIEVDRVRLRRDGALVEIELVASAFKSARARGAAEASRRPADADALARPSSNPTATARGAAR